jgi:ATP-binding cassette, subfamily B, bacterial HlyB/CyaB
LRDEAIGVHDRGALAALAAVARRRGFETTAEQLFRSYPSAAGTPSSAILVAIARDLGLEARALNLRFDGLARLRKTLPAILMTRGGGALILEGVKDDPIVGAIVVLRDPNATSDAVVAVDQRRLAGVWDGDVILVKRRFAIKDESRPFGMAWLFGQVLRERRLFFDIALGSLVSTVFALAPPFIFMIVVDRVLVNHSYSTLTVLTGAILIMICFEMALGHLRRILTQIATTRIDGRLNLYVVEKLLKLPMDYFERNPTGKIMSKLGRMGQIRHFLTGQMFGAFLDSIPLLGLVPAMVILEWRLAIFTFALAGVVFIIVMVFMKPIGRRFTRLVRAEQARGAHLTESIYGMRTIKALALEGRRRQEWDVLVAETIAAHHELGLIANYPQTLTLPFERLMYSGSFILGAYLILNATSSPNGSSISPGAIIAFAMLAMRLGQPLIQVARLQQDLAEARGAIDEMAGVMNAPPEQGQTGRGLRQPIKGEIAFRDVSFRYSPEAPLALDRVAFGVPQGTMLGIMGRSGSGKTTVTRLLQGLNASYDGIIKIDGMDLREIELNHLRTSIGVVAQENFLFSGSIRDNIAMAKPEASFPEIVRAAQMAGAEEFIERMPRGYDTRLEEGAANLSGGQRQRLAIARALLIDPPVLVLDEATSALDAESEAIINANLRRIASGRTIVCISHRLSMLVEAQAILVLERGQVYDIGTHEALLARCDIYKQLWYQQNRHVERGIHDPFAVVRAAQG